MLAKTRVTLTTDQGTTYTITLQDVNQSAKSTLISGDKSLAWDEITSKMFKNRRILPNSVAGDLHAETGLLQQLHEYYIAADGEVVIVVSGEDVCTYCLSDMPIFARNSNLRSLQIIQTKSGESLFWSPGTKLKPR